MTREEYQFKLVQFYQLGEFVELIGGQASEMLEDIRRAETTGPMLDPTSWLHNHGKMEDDKAIVEAVLNFRNAVHRMKEKSKKRRGQNA